MNIQKPVFTSTHDTEKDMQILIEKICEIIDVINTLDKE